jgi:NAD(P)-dependent dehydrogenase (short-subunit alcohol dehydrogenase family)
MSDTPLTGKIAIVTGGGAGIGQAICVAFARAGAKLVCLDIDFAAAEKTATACGADNLALSCDVSSEADTKAAAAAAASKFGGIHILVNAAATDDRNGTILDITIDEWVRVLSVNLTGAFLMSRAVLPAMIAAGGGSIIHIASQLGRVAAPARAAYCTSKGAIIQLAKAMAIDHAAQNIRVNALSPGAIETRVWCYATATWPRRGSWRAQSTW